MVRVTFNCLDSFICEECGRPVNPENAGSQHRNHCPHCLTSLHADTLPGDRASLCKGRWILSVFGPRRMANGQSFTVAEIVVL
nr:RNHCP domain-containing protein [Enterococcus gallinarum]